jgi:hypothetical protein
VSHILRPGKASEKTPKEVIPPSQCEISQNASWKKEEEREREERERRERERRETSQLVSRSTAVSRMGEMRVKRRKKESKCVGQSLCGEMFSSRSKL